MVMMTCCPSRCSVNTRRAPTMTEQTHHSRQMATARNPGSAQRARHVAGCRYSSARRRHATRNTTFTARYSAHSPITEGQCVRQCLPGASTRSLLYVQYSSHSQAPATQTPCEQESDCGQKAEHDIGDSFELSKLLRQTRSFSQLSAQSTTLGARIVASRLSGNVHCQLPQRDPTPPLKRCRTLLRENRERSCHQFGRTKQLYTICDTKR